MTVPYGSIFTGYQMAVRIRIGVAQFGGDSIFELFGDEMLEALGFFVDLIPGIVQNVMQEAFEKAVVTNYFESALSAGGRKIYSMVLFIADEGRALGGKLLQHSRDRCGADSEPLRQSIAGHPVLVSAA